MCEDTADDNDALVDVDWSHTRITKHDKACVLQSTVEHNELVRKKSSTPLWRARKKRHGTSLLRTCDRKIEKLQKTKLTANSPQTHEVSEHEDSSSKNCHDVRPSPRFGRRAHRFRHVCPGTGQAKRAEIIPFRNASGRCSSQRGCAVKHYQLRHDQGTRASTTFNGKVSAAVPHVPDVRTVARFTKSSIN